MKFILSCSHRGSFFSVLEFHNRKAILVSVVFSRIVKTVKTVMPERFGN